MKYKKCYEELKDYLIIRYDYLSLFRPYERAQAILLEDIMNKIKEVEDTYKLWR